MYLKKSFAEQWKVEVDVGPSGLKVETSYFLFFSTSPVCVDKMFYMDI
jgi:hypothetical protein